mmetsp:Transcript_20384/g.32812  ORF Transcript_20384/g.32812 Transcript_20384/m.32812 type:complete len:121 (-) Transcript_20384:32-394(-)
MIMGAFLPGTIPVELNNLTSLIVLSLGYNFFTGTIPPLASLHQLNLAVFAYNQLTGGVPSELGSLVSLQDLMLQGQFGESAGLTGSLPPSLCDLIQNQGTNIYVTCLEDFICDCGCICSL